MNKYNDLLVEYYPKINIIGNYHVNEFIVLLMFYFDDITSSQVLNILPSNIEFPRVPYLMYHTPLKFDRIRNQCGVFVYQGFLDYQCELDGMRGIMVQKIIPDITIKICNQRTILKELDMVGINRMFIYGDFDNTAKYINEKYGTRDVVKKPIPT